MLLRRALSRYDAALTSSPYRTKCITASGISALGDVLVQYSNKHENFDVERTVRQVAFSCAMAPVTHNWFNLLGHVKAFGPVPATFVSVIIDQVCFSPATHIAYFAWTSWAKSRFTNSFSEIRADVQDTLLPALRANLAVWPAAVYLNVAYVPMQYRVLFMNAIGMGYGMLMNFMAHSARAAPSLKVSLATPNLERANATPMH